MHLLSILSACFASLRLVSAAQIVLDSSTSPAAAKKAFSDAGIVPHVIPTFDPVLRLDITYQYDTYLKRAVLGTNFTKDGQEDNDSLAIITHFINSRDEEFSFVVYLPCAT